MNPEGDVETAATGGADKYWKVSGCTIGTGRRFTTAPGTGKYRKLSGMLPLLVPHTRASRFR